MPSLAAASAAYALLIILAIAAGLRFYGINWDGGHHLHPDERFLAIVADKIRFPASLGGYFDTTRSPLNPYNQGFDGFAYGTLPLFLTRAVAEWLDQASYDRIHLVGRGLSALADTGTVLLTFLLGRQVYGRAVGLVAAALLAATVLHIQVSHFFAVDSFLAFFTTLALYAAYRAWATGGFGSFVLLGVAVGLAAGTKLSAALLAPIVAIVALIPPPGGQPRSSPTRTAGMLAGCGLSALVAYRVAEPYSFAGTTFLSFLPNLHRFSDLDRWVKISSGEIEVPFMIQWAGTPNPWFALDNLVQWGFGPAAGLSALAGLAVAAVQLLRWPRGAAHLLLVSWCAINLGYFGFQFAKFMRYFLPVYPALAVLAAWLLVEIGRRSSAHALPVRLTGRLVLPAVLAATALYAAMFEGIYSRPHSRIAASAWIYDNVAPGSTLAVEHWDDALPLRLPGRERRYAEVSMELYEEESRQKATKLAENLSRADYLILSSNRLYGSIPRLPERYPIAVEYYRLLFAGQLGFEPAARFDSRPLLLGLSLDDRGAQEDFTVYDHPTVLIFRKSEGFDAAYVAQRLAAVPLDQLQRTKPVEAGRRSGLALSPQEWRAVQAGGTWWARFSLDGFAAHWPVVAWLLTVEAVALAAFPLCWSLFPSLPDRGFALAKVLGIASASYFAWLIASLGLSPFGPVLAFAAVAAVAGVSCLIAARRVGQVTGRPGHVWKMVVSAEAVFLAAFGAMLLIRALNPDLWHSAFGGEKPMDFAYLNAVIKSPTFPPYDPWFAGGYINYYYYGFVIVAVLTLLSAVPPAQAYNLAIATIFAMTAVCAFSTAAALAAGPRPARLRRLAPLAAAGLISAIALLVLGNLDGAVQLRDALWRVGGGGVPSTLPVVTGITRALVGLIAVLRGAPAPAFDFWRSTRFIGPEDPGPIHEFPYFTFLYGDLHAHMLALPLQVATVLVGLQLMRDTRLIVGRAQRQGRLRWPQWSIDAWRLAGLVLVASLLVGTLRATNTWDFPTYLALTAGAAFVGLQPGRRLAWAPAITIGLVVVVILYGLSSVLFQPYLARYELFYTGVTPVRAITDVGQFLTVHGLLLVAVGGWLGVELARAAAVYGLAEERPAHVGYYGMLAPPIAVTLDLRLALALGLLLVSGVALFAAGRGTIAVVLGFGLAVATVALARRASLQRHYVALLIAAALGALLLPELVAVRGDVGRMNTVFKFYLQAWVLLSLAAGPAIVWAVGRLTRRRDVLHGIEVTRGPSIPAIEVTRGPSIPAWGRAWVVVLVMLGLAAAIYPLRATPNKLAHRFTRLPPTLDGTAFMDHAQYSDEGRDMRLQDDAVGIRWMLENVAGSPVVLEGNAPLYHWGSRFSVFTGLPTVIGWDWHQKQQRWGYQTQVEQRERDVRTAYETVDPATLRTLIEKYSVRFIVVGGVERAYYSAAGLEKFQRLVGNGLEVAYRAGELTIYRVAAS